MFVNRKLNTIKCGTCHTRTHWAQYSQIQMYGIFTDFIILTVQKKAKEIIEERDKIIASKRDSEIFFDAIVNPDNPNKELLLAAKEFKSLFS